MTNEKEITVNTDEIKDYLHVSLIKHRYVPIPREVETLSNIVFDFLVEKGIVEEDANEL